jgi:translation initiation factor IF-2
MDDKVLAVILKHSSPNSLLIIDHDKKLQEKTCPFDVCVLKDVGNFNKNDIVLVTSVRVTRELITVFIISGNPYYYYHFDII